MTRSERRYVIGLGLVFVALVVLQLLQPQPVDWRETYLADDARPYGSRVAFEQIGEALGVPVRAVAAPPYLVLDDLAEGRARYVPASDTVSLPTYVFVTADSFEPDEFELGEILHHAYRGATVVIAARSFPEILEDTLGIEPDYMISRVLRGEDSQPIRFVAPGLASLSARFTDRYAWPALSVRRTRADSLGLDVLARDSTGGAYLLRAPWGEGALLLTSVPMAFANAEVLYGGGGDFLAGLLAYLPEGRPIWWDDHVKPLARGSTSPMRFVMDHPSLSAAFRVGFVALLLLFVLEARRRERAMPIVRPPRNESLDFVRTLGSLYHQHGDDADLARKKATYFLDHLRTRFGLSIQPDDLPDAEALAERTGATFDQAESALKATRDAFAAERVTSDALRRIARDLDGFLRATR